MRGFVGDELAYHIGCLYTPRNYIVTLIGRITQFFFYKKSVIQFSLLIRILFLCCWWKMSLLEKMVEFNWKIDAMYSMCRHSIKFT